MSEVSEAGAAFLAAAEDSGGSPGGLAAPAGEQETGDGEAPRTAPPAPDSGNTAQAETTPAAEADLPEGAPVPWGRHKKVADEAAKYRTELRAYQDALGDVHPQDANVLLRAAVASAQLIAGGRATEAEGLLRKVAEEFGIEAAEEMAQAAGAMAEQAGGDGDDEIITRADLQRILAEQREQEAYEREVADLQGQLVAQGRELGYKPDGTDDDKLRWARVLTLAERFHGGDVKAAHEALEAERQAAIDAYLETKTGDASRIPRVADGDTPAAVTDEPKDFDQARAGLEAMLNNT